MSGSSRTAVKAAADIPLDQLRQHPGNPRKITKVRLEQLQRTLTAERDMLAARPLIALPDGTVIAGNQRLAAARELGWETIPVVYADLDQETAERWMLLDNRPAGEDDTEMLAAMLREMGARGGAGRPGRGKHAGTRWYGDNSQTSVFAVDRPKRSSEHPTMKPVDLIAQQLVNSTTLGDAVLDPFGGSGSTLIACETLNRRALLMEIEPGYCDVIRQRYADYVGRPELAP